MRKSDPFETANEQFHELYEAARVRIVRRLPVLVVLADSLILHDGEDRREIVFTDPSFHVIKAVAHIPIAIFALVSGGAPAQPALIALGAHAGEVTAALANATLEAAVLDNLHDILVRSIAFVDAVLAQQPASLDAFAGELGRLLQQTTENATRLQLHALDRHATEIVADLHPEDRRQYLVIVTGDHQARARSLAMQYFRKRLGERPGIETRVAYAEGISDEEGALALAATRQLDRVIASSFFGDPSKLQSDILGDAVEVQLRTWAPAHDDAYRP